MYSNGPASTGPDSSATPTACGVSRLGSVRLDDGRQIERYRLQAGGLALEVIDAGCAITRLDVPDRAGRLANVVLGHARPGDYLGLTHEYFGAIVGRVANRIARGRFCLEGRRYELATNDGPHHLHGGRVGFDRKCWRVVRTQADEVAAIEFELESPDGDEGYPGRLRATVRYELWPGGELHLRYSAVTSATTLVNLTNHSYFNLCGDGRGNVLDHELAIAADAFCEVDETLIPTGRLPGVADTPFDFRRSTRIGSRIGVADPQLAIAGGYDHCLVLDRGSKGGLQEACVLVDRTSGRRLVVSTDQPGVQLYTGNFLDGSARGPSGSPYERHAGLCLETQAFPDAPHHAGFPSIELEPGQRYQAETVWRFEVLP